MARVRQAAWHDTEATEIETLLATMYDFCQVDYRAWPWKGSGKMTAGGLKL